VSASPNAVDAAVRAVLATDPTLATLFPDGVYFGDAGAGAVRFIQVQPVEYEDEPGLNGETLWERIVYLVRAVALATEGVTALATGADRIQALLHGVPLTVTGYTWMMTRRLAHQRDDPEIDAVDSDQRFQKRGGMYELHLSPE
jgi:hypothetical protein